MVIIIENEPHFQSQMAGAGARLVVVDFTASWCGPCQRIAPLFETLPNKYPKAVFLKVDVDRCQELAQGQGVSAMPTFIFYKNRVKIDRIQGADFQSLEAKIAQHVNAAGGSGGDDAGEEYGQGMMDLSSFISKNECECLNESDDHTLEHALNPNGGFLQSDCDEQLIISVTFNQVVKIHSIKLKAPGKLGPKEIKLFINQPRTIDFDQAESMASVQDLSISEKDLIAGQPVSLRYVKFQNVGNIQIYVRNNQSGGDVTQIDHICFIGSPLTTTKMNDFKRVAGKKGESH